MAWKTSKKYFNEVDWRQTNSDDWIARHEEPFFKTNCLRCGLVENIQSRRAATLVIAQRKNETPLSWHEVWSDKNVEFGRVLLLIDRLRPSQNEIAYGKEAVMFDVLKEGDAVMVELKNAVQSPDNIFRFFANSAFRVGGLSNTIRNSLELIRDPLRGVVDSILMKDVGVIRFGTYDGRIAKSLFSIDSLYFKGEKLKKHLPLVTVAPINAPVFLEVIKWNIKEVNQEWEKMQYKDGVIFRASLVWLKDDPRPSRGSYDMRQKSSSNERRQNTGSNDRRQNTGSNEFGSAQTKQVPENKPRNKTSTASNSGENDISGHTLTNINAYYGRVEVILGGACAVVCTAHRNGEPLTFNENWCARGVSLERIFLMTDHVRPSKTAPPYAKGLQIRSILKVGDPLRVVVDPTDRNPEKIYKWFAKTCWKVNEEESGSLMTPVNEFPGHLCGRVENLIAHNMGIISFKTYHGFSSKAFFTHYNFYKDGKKIMNHLPLGSEINKGAEVFLIADKWRAGTNMNDLDQELIKNEVGFKALLVWTKGSRKPDEESDSNKEQEQRSFGYEPHKQGFQRRGFHEKHSSRDHQDKQSGSRTREFKAADNKFSRARGMRHGRGRGRHHRGRGRGDADCHSNCSENSESNMSDISTVSDYFGVMNFDDEFDVENVDKERNLIRFSNPDLTQPLAFQHIPSEKGINGTLVSVDENWGIVQINEQQVHDFKCNVVYLYGLKLENVPLHRLFHQGQSVKVHLKGEKVLLLEYGTPQLPYLMRKAVMTYCEQKSVPHIIKDMLDNLMKNNGI